MDFLNRQTSYTLRIDPLIFNSVPDKHVYINKCKSELINQFLNEHYGSMTNCFKLQFIFTHTHLQGDLTIIHNGLPTESIIKVIDITLTVNVFYEGDIAI